MLAKDLKVGMTVVFDDGSTVEVTQDARPSDRMGGRLVDVGLEGTDYPYWDSENVEVPCTWALAVNADCGLDSHTTRDGFPLCPLHADTHDAFAALAATTPEDLS